jgi:hypothetical protein
MYPMNTGVPAPTNLNGAGYGTFHTEHGLHEEQFQQPSAASMSHPNNLVTAQALHQQVLIQQMRLMQQRQELERQMLEQQLLAQQQQQRQRQQQEQRSLLSSSNATMHKASYFYDPNDNYWKVRATNGQIVGVFLSEEQAKHFLEEAHPVVEKRVKEKRVKEIARVPEYFQIKQAMQSLNLTRSQVAEYCGIRANVFSRFMNGNSQLPGEIPSVRKWLKKLQGQGHNVMSRVDAQALAARSGTVVGSKNGGEREKPQRRSRRKQRAGKSIHASDNYSYSPRKDGAESDEDVSAKIGPNHQADVPPWAHGQEKTVSNEDAATNVPVERLIRDFVAESENEANPMHILWSASEADKAFNAHLKGSTLATQQDRSHAEAQTNSYLQGIEKDFGGDHEQCLAHLQEQFVYVTERPEMPESPGGSKAKQDAFVVLKSQLESTGGGAKLDVQLSSKRAEMPKGHQWPEEARVHFAALLHQYGRDFTRIGKDLRSKFSGAMASSGPPPSYSNALFSTNDCSRYFFDEFTRTPDFAAWISHGKPREEKIMEDQAITLEDYRDDDHENGTHDAECMVCGGIGELLMCDTCSNVAHLACNSPPLSAVPKGQWFCMVCKSGKSIKSLVAEYREKRTRELNLHSSSLTVSPYDLFFKHNEPAFRSKYGTRDHSGDLLQEAIRQEWEDLNRRDKLRFITKANEVRQAYKEGVEKVNAEAKKYERKLRVADRVSSAKAARSHSSHVEERDDAEYDAPESEYRDAEQDATKAIKEWGKYQRKEKKRFIAEQYGVKYPVIPYGKFLKEQSVTGSCTKKEASLLWKKLPADKKAQRGEMFGRELVQYRNKIKAIEKTKEYKKFDRRLNSTTRLQWERQHFAGSGKRPPVEKAKKRKMQASSHDHSRQAESPRQSKKHRSRKIDAFTFDVDFYGAQNRTEHNCRPGKRQKKAPKNQHKQHKQQKQPAAKLVEPNPSEMNKFWSKRRRQLLKEHMKKRNIIHPGAPYVMFTRANATREGVDGKGTTYGQKELPKIWSGAGMKAVWTKKFDEVLENYRKDRAKYERTSQYVKFVERVDTVLKEKEYSNLKRKYALQHSMYTDEGKGKKVSKASKSMIEVVGMQERMWALYRKRKVAAFEKAHGLTRPASAYVLFMSDKRKEGAVVSGSGPAGGITSKDISKIWNKMSQSARGPWIKRFERMQDTFKTDKSKLEKTKTYKTFLIDLDTTGMKKWQAEQQGLSGPTTNQTERRAARRPLNQNREQLSSSETESEESSSEESSSEESSASEYEVENVHVQGAANRRSNQTIKGDIEKQWSKIRAQKMRDYMKAADVRRPCAPFLRFYMGKAKAEREQAAKEGRAKKPLDRKRMAAEFDSLDPKVKNGLIAQYEVELGEYYDAQKKLKSSKKYAQYVSKLEREKKTFLAKQQRLQAPRQNHRQTTSAIAPYPPRPNFSGYASIDRRHSIVPQQTINPSAVQQRNINYENVQFGKGEIML